MNDVKIDLLRTPEDIAEEEACKGLIFRGRVSTWFDGTSIHTKKSLVLLKRRSCAGCKYCDWILDFLKEDLGNNPFEDVSAIIEDGKMYTIVFDISEDGEDDIEGWTILEVRDKIDIKEYKC